MLLKMFRFSLNGHPAPFHKNTVLALILAVILLCGSGDFSETFGIDVYHFLVEYENGRIVEKIISESPVAYQNYHEGYVARTRLLERRQYSVDGFIQTFGYEGYERFMAGYFGFGLEEQIIFNRQTQGLETNAMALPPADETSAKLLEIWKELEKEKEGVFDADHGKTSKPKAGISEQKSSQPPLKKTTPQIETEKVPEIDEKKVITSSPGNAENAPLQDNAEKAIKTDTIDIYVFLVQYINGETLEKTSGMTPRQYANHYRGYVRKTALLQKKTYTENEFKKAFGKKGHSLLIQGNFGVSDIEMVMQSRMERGMPPHKNILPGTGPDAKKLGKKLEQLLAQDEAEKASQASP